MKKACSITLAVLFLIFFSREALAQVVINEFLPAPSSGNPEWVEFYNTASSSTDLSDYYFDDDDSFASDSGNSQMAAISGILPALSTCYWDLSSYLNNNGDKPTLFNTSGTAIDSYSYTSTQSDKSYGRVPDGGSWEQNITSTKSSTSCIDLTPTPSPTPVPTATPTVAPTATAAPTPTKTPTPTPTKTPSPTPSKTSSPSLTPEATVLGESFSPSPTAIAGEASVKKFNLLPFILIGGGVFCLGFAGYSVFKNFKSTYNSESGKEE